MNQAAFQLADRKELQRAIKGKRFYRKKGAGMGKLHWAKKSRLVLARLLPLGTARVYQTDWASQVSQWKRTCLPIQEMQVRSLGQEDPLEEEMATLHQYSCLRDPTNRAAWSVVHGVTKSQTWLSIWTKTTAVSQTWLSIWTKTTAVNTIT